jgi:hypothetical protein
MVPSVETMKVFVNLTQKAGSVLVVLNPCNHFPTENGYNGVATLPRGASYAISVLGPRKTGIFSYNFR